MNENRESRNFRESRSSAERLLDMYRSTSSQDESRRIEEAVRELEQERNIDPQKLMRRASR